MRQLIIATLLLSLTLPLLAAEDEAVFSGPLPGERITPLSIRLAYGPNTKQSCDPGTHADGAPIVLLFVHQPNRPAGNFTRAVLNYCEMFEPDGLRSALIYLHGDTPAATEQLQRGASWFGVGVPAGVSLDGAEGPGAYGLNRNVTITVVVAKDNKVTANFALVQPSLTEVDEVLSPVTELIDSAFVPNDDQVQYLFSSTHLAPHLVEKGGQATRDPNLRLKILTLLTADNPQKINTAAQAIEAYVADNAKLQHELFRSAKMLLNRRANQYNRELKNKQLKPILQRWVKTHQPK
ncbi:MAG: hypothetical protein ACYTGQ_06765 [Planctomycetota bacterium]|jgi:hypothetical protein